jgi:hypothetical protein
LIESRLSTIFFPGRFIWLQDIEKRGGYRGRILDRAAFSQRHNENFLESFDRLLVHEQSKDAPGQTFCRSTCPRSIVKPIDAGANQLRARFILDGEKRDGG